MNNSKVMCSNIRRKRLFLYGKKDDIKRILELYKDTIAFEKVVTDYKEDVVLQAFSDYGIQTVFFDEVVSEENVLFIICSDSIFGMCHYRFSVINRIPYKDYISYHLLESVVSEKELMLCMGSVLMRQVVDVIGKSPDIKEKYDIVFFSDDKILTAYKNYYRLYTHIGKVCDCYIRSACEKNKYERKVLDCNILPPNCNYITVSDYGFAGYFPMVDPNRDKYNDYFLRVLERKDEVYDKFVASREDTFLMSLILSGAEKNDIKNRVMDVNIFSKDEIVTFFTQELNRIKKCEQNDDIKVHDFILENRKIRLCRGLEEWDERMVFFIANEISKKLGIGELDVNLQQYAHEPIGTELPVYPAVIKALDLDMPYDYYYKVITFNSVRNVTYDEYMDYLIDYLSKTVSLMEFTHMNRTLGW